MHFGHDSSSGTQQKKNTVRLGHVKILNTIIYFTNFDKSFGVTNRVILSSDYIELNVVSIYVNFPLVIFKSTVILVCLTWINTSLMRLFPLSHITSKRTHFSAGLNPHIMITVHSLLLQTPSSTCKAHLDRKKYCEKVLAFQEGYIDK